MPEDNREDISLDYAFISLIASEIEVIIIGGGQSGYIKAKSFLKKGCNVSVISKEFNDKFKYFDKNLKLIKGEYTVEHIVDKHLVVIATDDNMVNRNIARDCKKHRKIFLDTSDFKKGQFVTPIEVKTENMNIAIHTKAGSPKTSMFLAEKIRHTIDEYDDFIKYIGDLRKNILNSFKDKNINLEIMNFVNSDDFYEFYKADKHKLILKLFWRDYFDI